MRARHQPVGDRLGAGWVRRWRSRPGSTWVCGPSGLLPSGGGIGWNTSTRPSRLTNTRCGLVAQDDAHRRGCRTPDVRNSARSCAAISGSAMRTQQSTCSAPRPRSNRTAWRSLLAQRVVSAPSSVSTVRPLMAHRSSGRQSATRWFQLSLVVVSKANGRMSVRSAMRMPPRSVTAASDVMPRDSAAGSPASRANSAMAPKVPTLHCVSASCHLRVEERDQPRPS